MGILPQRIYPCDGDVIFDTTGFKTRYTDVKLCKRFFHPYSLSSSSLLSRIQSICRHNFTSQEYPCNQAHSHHCTIENTLPPVGSSMKSSHALSYLSISSVFIILFGILAQPTLQQQNPLCPKNCTCDEQSLETLCKEPIGTSGIPHTLNPATTKIVINNAQTTQLIGLELFSKLEYLDLARNKLSYIDFKEISKTPQLKFLNTSHNNIMDLKDSLLTALSSLSMSDTSIFSPDVDSSELDVLRKLPKISISSLYLDHNDISYVSNFTFIRWHRLQRLDLSYNIITSIDRLALAGLGRLEYINLRSNRLKQVPSIAFQNTMLSIFSSNVHLGPTTSKPSSLRVIDLGENSLSSLNAESFMMLEKVQELYLDSCTIHNIHEEAFKGLHTLSMLSLDRNNLAEVPSRSFSYLSFLRILKLNSNQIRELHSDAFIELINLEELQINNGTFNELVSGLFRGLSNLRHLEVTYNPNLTSIQRGTLDFLHKLRHIDLQYNSLYSLPDDLSRGSLESLDLRNNSLVCDCDLKWLTKWLKTFDATQHTHLTSKNELPVTETRPQNLIHDSSYTQPRILMADSLVNLTCFGPAALAGRHIKDLPDNKLECLEPGSDINLKIGFGLLFLLASMMTVACFTNFCRDKQHLLEAFKESLVQNQISMMLPYRSNLHKNVDSLRKETQLYGSEYEVINYGNPGQLQTVYNDQVLYCGPQHPYYSQHF